MTADGKEAVTESWAECTKVDICSGGLDQQHFHPKPADDDEHVDNLVEKLNILCETKERIGLIGVLYLGGVVMSLIVFPWAADKVGRKIPFVATMLVSLVG